MNKRIYFLSPLKGEVYGRGDESGDAEDIWDGYDLLGYQDQIREAIRRQEKYAGANLMEYYDQTDSVKAKVKYLEIAVAEQDRELKGCAVATITEPLNPKELAALKEYLTGQYADGWGEGFEQQAISIDEGELYVHFWQWDQFQIEVLQELKLPEQAEKKVRPVMHIDLGGQEGNIFFVEGKAGLVLCQAGREKEVDEMGRRVRKCRSYRQALGVINEYVEITPDYLKQLDGKVEKRKTDRER